MPDMQSHDRQGASFFEIPLQPLSNLEFGVLVRKQSAEPAPKGFSCGTHLATMLFCQLARRRKQASRGRAVVPLVQAWLPHPPSRRLPHC